MFPDKIYYEEATMGYELGHYLKQKYQDRTWIPIDSHNKIDELRTRPNSDFREMKQYLIIGIRKTHRHVPNAKVSDFLVPYTSSGCIAACLYCYLVCNYNKCSYLRLFVNREEMLDKIMKSANRSLENLTFEIGSNSDLVLENTITHNLEWTIERFVKNEKGSLTFPTKFANIAPLLPLQHGGRIIFRMSVNPEKIIRQIELGTSPLNKRIEALNQMCEAGYPCGILIAPVIFLPGWQDLYRELITVLSEKLSEKVKKTAFIEIIFMSYSFVHRKINEDAFPDAPELYDKELMQVRGRGKYGYHPSARQEGVLFLRAELARKLPHMKILYFS